MTLTVRSVTFWIALQGFRDLTLQFHIVKEVLSLNLFSFSSLTVGPPGFSQNLSAFCLIKAAF